MNVTCFSADSNTVVGVPPPRCARVPSCSCGTGVCIGSSRFVGTPFFLMSLPILSFSTGTRTPSPVRATIIHHPVRSLPQLQSYVGIVALYEVRVVATYRKPLIYCSRFASASVRLQPCGCVLHAVQCGASRGDKSASHSEIARAQPSTRDAGEWDS